MIMLTYLVGYTISTYTLYRLAYRHLGLEGLFAAAILATSWFIVIPVFFLLKIFFKGSALWATH